MITKMQKWGNSQGLRIPREILSRAAITLGEEVDISAKKGAIIIKSALSVRGRYSLRDLVSRMPQKYEPGEEDWGKPIGKEVW
jgi:antitoxin MazE